MAVASTSSPASMSGAHRQAGQFETGAHPPLLAEFLLPPADRLQEPGQGQLLFDPVLEELGQLLGDVLEPQAAGVPVQPRRGHLDEPADRLIGYTYGGNNLGIYPGFAYSWHYPAVVDAQPDCLRPPRLGVHRHPVGPWKGSCCWRRSAGPGNVITYM